MNDFWGRFQVRAGMNQTGREAVGKKVWFCRLYRKSLLAIVFVEREQFALVPRKENCR